MPVIRISQEHKELLEKGAVKETTRREKILTISQYLAEILDKELKKGSKATCKKKEK